MYDLYHVVTDTASLEISLVSMYKHTEYIFKFLLHTLRLFWFSCSQHDQLLLLYLHIIVFYYMFFFLFVMFNESKLSNIPQSDVRVEWMKRFLSLTTDHINDRQSFFTLVTFPFQSGCS